MCIILYRRNRKKLLAKKGKFYMDEWRNILDEDILKTNVHFAALFVLNFECLKEFVVEQVRDFYSDFSVEDGKEVNKEMDSYKEEVRKLDDRQLDNASLKWFLEAGAISQDDYDTYQLIRQRRNDITHELLKHLSIGFHQDDIELFTKMLNLYRKLDKWWINEIEIPISAENIPEDYDREGVFGSQAMCLSIINDIVLGDGGEKYKDVMGELTSLNNL